MLQGDPEGPSTEPIGGTPGGTRAGQDEVDRARFVESNLRLVVRVAREFYIPHGMEFVDVVQNGVIGLMRAADRFDPSAGVPFAAYALWWIRRACLNGIQEQGRVIRLPANVHAKLAELRRAQRELGHRGRGTAPSDRELARELRIDRGQLLFLQELDTTTLVVERVDEDGNEVQIVDGLPQSTFERPDDASAREQSAANIRSVVARLTSRQRFILTRRFGLDGGPEESLGTLGRQLRLSAGRIRQIEAVILKRLSTKLKPR